LRETLELGIGMRKAISVRKWLGQCKPENSLVCLSRCISFIRSSELYFSAALDPPELAATCLDQEKFVEFERVIQIQEDAPLNLDPEVSISRSSQKSEKMSNITTIPVRRQRY
jgi:hypothetical protein